jgi:hypothetical protein
MAFQKVLKGFGLLLSSITLAVSFQNCSNSSYDIDKNLLIEQSSVFSASSNLNKPLPDSRLKQLQDDLDASNEGVDPLISIGAGGTDVKVKVCFLSGNSGPFIKAGDSRYVLENPSQIFEPAQCTFGGTRKIFELGHNEVCNGTTGKLEKSSVIKKLVGEESCGKDPKLCPPRHIVFQDACTPLVCSSDIISDITNGTCKESCQNSGTTLGAKSCLCSLPGSVLNSNQSACECPSGQVVANGKCQVVVCSAPRITTIQGGTCTEACENSGTSYGAKSCSCDASKGLSFNTGTQSCQCAAGKILINGSCREIPPNGISFGGDYQCFGITNGNKEQGGVVAAASEVVMIVSPGHINRDTTGPANIIYRTNKAANGKSLKQDILDNNGLLTTVAVPPGASDGPYTVVFYDPSYTLGSLAQVFTDPTTWRYYDARKVFRGSGYFQGYINLKGGKLVDDLGQPLLISGTTFVLNWAEANDPRCEGHISSPLVIDVRRELKKGSSGVNLTSQIKGVLYDIMGLNASPVAHDKKQISWFENPESFMLLALPNSEGQVNGINELFGNNTKGPDGRFPAHGYQALEKYDKNLDGKIDSRDPVFTKLRLWGDLNKNGSAEINELFTLDEIGLTLIDLEYDKNYIETDSHGNQTTMKSVVQFKNGAMRLIFDLWFKHNN